MKNPIPNPNPDPDPITITLILGCTNRVTLKLFAQPQLGVLQIIYAYYCSSILFLNRPIFFCDTCKSVRSL